MSSSSFETESEENVEQHHSRSKLHDRHMSNIQFIANTVIYSLNITFVQDLSHHQQDKPSIIQLVVSTLLFSMPLQFMQVVIGQYTQNSGINMCNMCPLGKGIGWGFMIDSFAQFLSLTLFTGDVLLYTFHTCQSVMPWTMCKGFNSSVCWDKKPCEGPCLAKRELPSSAYYVHVFSQIESWWGIRRVATMFTIMVIVYIAMSMFKNVSTKMIVIIYFSAFGSLCVTCALFMNLNSNQLGYLVMKHLINFDQIFNYNAWLEAFSYSMLMSSIGKGGFILYGSHFEGHKETGIIVVCSSVFLLICTGVIYVMMNSAQSFLLTLTNSTDVVEVESNHFFLVPMLTTIPETLSYVAFPQIFTASFFLSCLICLIITIIVNLRIIEMSITDSFASFYRYRKYFLFMFMISSVGINLFLITWGLSLYSGSHFIFTLIGYDSLVVMTFSVVASWVYGVQRLSDDMHFMTGSEPTIFWKGALYCIPILTFCAVFKQIRDVLELRFANESFFILLVAYSPYIFMAFLNIFKLMKHNNLIGFFRPDPLWGPRNVEERMLRQIFNPRMETKSRRRNDLCTHNCLLNNKVLKVVVDREMDRASDASTSTVQ